MGYITMTKEEVLKILDNYDGNEIKIKIEQDEKALKLVPLRDVELGKTICNGKYVVVEHFENGTTGIIKKDAIKPGIQFGNTNEWNRSDLRKYLNTEYLKKITSEFSEIELHTVDMLSMDGDDFYGKCEDLVSVMTFDRWRKYHKYIGNASCMEWLSTPNQTKKHGDTFYVQFVCSDGFVRGGGCDWVGYGVRPFFILKSSNLVSVG